MNTVLWTDEKHALEYAKGLGLRILPVLDVNRDDHTDWVLHLHIFKSRNNRINLMRYIDIISGEEEMMLANTVRLHYHTGWNDWANFLMNKRHDLIKYYHTPMFKGMQQKFSKFV